MKACSFIAISILLIAEIVLANGNFIDNFNDGSIDTGLWTIGGEKRGPFPTTPVGVGDWVYSHEEITDSGGYLKMRVAGPTSANSYGADAWLRTNYDYNDGQSHLINFVFGAEVDTRASHFLVQITDGYIPDPGEHNWYASSIEGTTNLAFLQLPPGTDQTYSWSIKIDPVGVVKLYDNLDGIGNLLYENSTLDLSKSWHTRFMVACATSAGFPAGDSRMNIYSIESVPEPATLLLLGLGGLAIRKRAKGR